MTTSIAYKNGKKIVQRLQNPRLRKIRYEFRMLLKLWYHDKINHYYDKITEIGMDKSLSYDEQKQNRIKIIRKKDKLMEEFLTFPLGCRICADSKVNLMYLPEYGTWYCADGLHKRIGEVIAAKENGSPAEEK